VYLTLIYIEPPQILALGDTGGPLIQRTEGTDNTSAGGARISAELYSKAAPSPQFFRLPFVEARKDESGLIKSVVAIKLSSEIFQNGEACRKSGISPDARFGVLFPQIFNGGDFYFNGIWVAGLPGSSEKVKWTWYRPFFILLPPHLIKCDGTPNIITAVQTTYQSNTSVVKMYFGATEEVIRTHEFIIFINGALTTVSNTLSLVFGVFLLSLWTVSRKETMYGIAGVASLAWAALITLARWNQLDIALYGVWQSAIYTLAHLLVYLMSLLILSFIGVPLRKWVRNCVLSIGCIGPIVTVLGGVPWEQHLQALSALALLILALYSTFCLANYCRESSDFLAYVLLLQSVLFLASGFLDYSLISGAIKFFSLESPGLTWGELLLNNIYLAHLIAPLHLGVMVYVFFRRYRNNIEAVKNRDAFIEASRLEYEKTFEELYQHQISSARFEGADLERDRIYKDLHDGIGSQLVKAIFALRKNNGDAVGVVSNLQECLRDLRHIINAQSESYIDVQSAVFAFCQTQEVHLQGSGLTISCDVGVESTTYSDPKINLNILRILQETLCNSIKHSDASEVFVKLKTDNSNLLLCITDHGYTPLTGRGNWRKSLYGESGQQGVSGLVSRAAALGGTCSINTRRSGTQVCVSIPLPKTV